MSDVRDPDRAAALVPRADGGGADESMDLPPGLPVRRGRRGGRAPRALAVGVAIATGSIGLVWLLAVISLHAFSGNSDGATVVLEGQSISAGHVLLAGWGLSRDSFWTIDALVYAAVISLIGVHRELLHLVPALIAVGVVAIGGALSIEGRRGAARLAGPMVLVVILGLPNPVLAFFTLQGPWHVGTALWGVVAFALLGRGGLTLSWAAAVVVLAAGVLGDYETLAYATAPVFIVGVAEMVRQRSLRPGLATASAAPASLLVAFVVRTIARAIGTFSIAKGVTHAIPGRFGINLVHSLTWGAGLFGVRGVKIGPAPVLSADDLTNGTTLSHVAHLPGLALVAGALVASTAVLVLGLVRGPTASSGGVPRWARAILRGDASRSRIDDLLLFATAGSIVSFVMLCPNNNGDYARYLSAGVIFASVLGARWFGRVAEHCSHGRFALVPLLAVGAVAGVIGFTVAQDLGASAATEPPAELEAFLEAHHLTKGVGDYWSASIISVETAERVVVRPVITDLATGRLVRYERQSDASWYAGQHFQFLVFDTAHPWRTVDAATAMTTFGSPRTTYAVGSYRVFVFSHPVSISSVGFTRG